jgi:hypothetical protein
MTMAKFHNSNHDHQSDALDRELDAALAKYSAVEPRAGLQDGIFARLRSAAVPPLSRSWWRWGFAGAAAALAIVAVFAWRSTRASDPVVADHPPTTIQKPSAPRASNREISNEEAHSASIRRRGARHAATALAVPRLDRFPSPESLTEQEKLALEYVEKFPEEASLMAQAQTNLARQQEIEQREDQTNPQ